MKIAPAITRKNFNDSDKAKIFVRDRATCCFSGANLWLLDAPVRVGWQSDWADHKIPISRGGKADWEKNGVCASHTYNMKKRNNSADTTHLFENGHPTTLYYDLFGSPPTHVTERLQRLSKLQESDWYFNRALTWIFEALNFKWWPEADYTRKDTHWFDAAFKKLSIYRKILKKKPELLSFEDRGLIKDPSDTQKILLSIRNCDTRDSMKERALHLSSEYSMNSEAWWEYFHPENYDLDTPAEMDLHRREAYQNAHKIKDQLNTETFACIQIDHKIRFGFN
jgi:hypothetical protein